MNLTIAAMSGSSLRSVILDPASKPSFDRNNTLVSFRIPVDKPATVYREFLLFCAIVPKAKLCRVRRTYRVVIPQRFNWNAVVSKRAVQRVMSMSFKQMEEVIGVVEKTNPTRDSLE